MEILNKLKKVVETTNNLKNITIPSYDKIKKAESDSKEKRSIERK